MTVLSDQQMIGWLMLMTAAVDPVKEVSLLSLAATTIAKLANRHSRQNKAKQHVHVFVRACDYVDRQIGAG